MSPTHLWSSRLSLIALLAGCSNDTVNLGGGRAPLVVQPGERCNGPSIVQGPVTVHNQDEIEQLAGCQEIDGELHIEIFEDADLTPLSSLRTVDGLLEIGAYPDAANQENADLGAIKGQVDRIVHHDRFLTSLAGLEGLQRVSTLSISSIAAQDLEPLLGLTQLSGRVNGVQPAGSLYIESAKNLRDLHGLSSIASVQELALISNPALASLGGIRLGTINARITLSDSPLLSSLAELGSVQSAIGLSLTNLGLTNLDDLANLGYVEQDISIVNNALLENVDGLANLNSAESLMVLNNAILQSIPSLKEMRDLDKVTVVDNPELQSLHLDLPNEGDGPYSLRGSRLSNPITLIDIGRNDSLTELSISEGLRTGRAIAVYDNAALLHVSLGSLQRLEELDITGNTNLEQIEVGSLKTVDYLLVTNNPKLDDTQLEAVRSFTATVSRNAGTP
jgi:hypothetical protein